MATAPTTAVDTIPPGRHRPRTLTVFIAAFAAGAVAAVGVNRFLDIRLAQSRPQVECEPIFVALRSLPQGAPVTVWDVALRDWPKAGMPASALRATDSFEGCVLRHAVREGQPLLAVQLVRGGDGGGQPTIGEEPFVEPPAAPPSAQVDDLWLPAATAATPAAPAHPKSTEATAPTTVDEPEVAVADEPATAATEPTVAPEAAAPPAETAATPSTDPASPTETVAIPTPPPADVAAAPPAMPTEEPAPAPEAADVPAETEATVIPAVPTQPTVAAPSPAAPEIREPPARLAADLDPPPSTVDAESLPSVMARSDEAATAGEPAAGGERIRYLVVPERIARQADTSFTTPAATPPAEQPAVGTDPRPAATPPQGQPAQAVAPATRKPAGPSATRTKPTPTRTAPGKQPRQTPERGPVGPRAWGAVFPNVSAGLESIGGWRARARESVADDRPADPQPARR